MLPKPSSNIRHQIIEIPYFLRWQIYHRLQELEITCCCREDGSLQVQVDNWIVAIKLSLYCSSIHSITQIVNRLVGKMLAALITLYLPNFYGFEHFRNN